MNDQHQTPENTAPQPHPGDGPALPTETPQWPDGQTRRGHDGFSRRQHAATALRVPDSGLPWLDRMIQRSRRDEFAKAALSGLFANERYEFNQDPTGDAVARDCMITAERMLAAAEQSAPGGTA